MGSGGPDGFPIAGYLHYPDVGARNDSSMLFATIYISLTGPSGPVHSSLEDTRLPSEAGETKNV